MRSLTNAPFGCASANSQEHNPSAHALRRLGLHAYARPRPFSCSGGRIFAGVAGAGSRRSPATNGDS